MRNLLIPAIVLFFTARLFAGEPDKEFHEKCLYPTIMVQVKENMMHQRGSGSGVIFKSHRMEKEVEECKEESKKETKVEYLNFALTCSHVVSCSIQTPLFPVPAKYVVKKANYKDWSTFVDYTTYDCEVVHKDPDSDWAVIAFVTEEKMPIADLAIDTKLYIGNDIFRIGCGLGDSMRVDYGKITSTNFTIKDFVKDVYRMSIPTISGDSGGPVFHKTEDGYKVVGLAQAIRSMKSTSRVPISHGFIAVPVQHPLPHIAFAVPFKKIEGLEDICQKKITEPPLKEAPPPPSTIPPPPDADEPKKKEQPSKSS